MLRRFQTSFTRSATLGALFLFVQAVLATPVWSHPLGNYSINQYFLVDVRETPPVIHYLVDMAEIPSFTELDLLDTNFDSEVTDEEIEKYLSMKVPPLLANLDLAVNGNDVGLELRDSELALIAGEGGMVIFNVLLTLAPISWPDVAAPFEFKIASTNFEDESGVRECMLILDNHFRDDTRSLGEDRLKYQTLVFLDDNRNPVYQDFDAEFDVKLTETETEPITGPNATRVAFQWTSTAKSAEEKGEEELVAAFGETVEPAPDSPAAPEPENGEPQRVATLTDTAESSETVVPPAPPSPGRSSLLLPIALVAVVLALAIGIAIGRRSR